MAADRQAPTSPRSRRPTPIHNLRLNPIEDAPKLADRTAEAQAERRPWTQEEVKAFLTGFTKDRLYAVCLLSPMGLRPAEVCGLPWSDVDLEAGTIAAGENTGRSSTRGRGEAGQVGGRQTRLTMPATAAKVLKAFQTLQKKERLKAGDVYVDSNHLKVAAEHLESRLFG
ncbi:tyrosine-type recombinase/integrase [Micromonospora sp. M71_S20]|uniref:tyrosine-type recombinase/integrase n=1 Tax=Micromonospora sp. M71_S20 TaxID=592872 RepID=UPI0011E5EBA2|nr:tyrosine-type recombinase/integrase [Micromonospora sp. M71_S20]